MAKWAGRRVRRIVNAVLSIKGTTCHLCGLPGADSADHDPPRSALLLAGVPDPDSLAFLFPAHRYPCNVSRQDRIITPELRAELRAKRLAYLGHRADDAPLSPRFARRARPPHLFERATPSEAPRPLPYLPETPGKNEKTDESERSERDG